MRCAAVVVLVACSSPGPVKPQHGKGGPDPAELVPFDADGRVAELATLRDVLRENYAHLETKSAQWNLDLDALYKRYEPEFRAADTWSKYELASVGFLSEFHDGHIQWRRKRGASEVKRKVVRLGLYTQLVGDALIVSDVWPGSGAEAAKLAVGDRIVAVDGAEMQKRLDGIAKLRSWSRIEDARYDFAQSWPAFRVPADKPPPPHQITRERDDGTRETLSIVPETKPLKPSPPPIELEMRGDVAIFRVRSLKGHVSDTQKAATAAATDIFAKATALVVDLRDNEGGYEDGGAAIVAALSAKPVVAGVTRVRLSDRTRSAHKEWKDLAEDPARAGWSVAQPIKVDGKAAKDFRGKIAVVIDAGCRSSCESVALYFRAMGATLVGETTGGTGGAPITINLERSKARVSIPARAAFDLKNQPIEGKGVAPDIAVTATIDDIKAKRDAPLLRAIDTACARGPGGC